MSHAVESCEVRVLLSAHGPDFNNDGFDDLAVGAPGENQGAGAVSVIYGSPSGLADNNRTQHWEQGAGGLDGIAQSFDLFGKALAWGDFNNDSFDDLAIGVPGETVSGQIRAGAVQVLYGSRAGLQPPVRIPSILQVSMWHQDSAGTAGAILDQAEADDGFGFTLAVGDFNADGFHDLAVGVPREDLGSASNPIWDAGAVNVIYGSRAGLSFTNQLWSQDSSFNGVQIRDQAETDDFFGFSLAVGDFNGDWKDDLAVGVPLEDIGTLATGIDAGAVSVIYAAPGRGSGLDANRNQILHQGIRDPAEANDQFGRVLAAGDFGGGLQDDLAIGVPGENLGSSSNPIINAGAVEVVYGSSSGLDISTTQFWTQSMMAGDGAEEGDYFGSSLCAADFDGSGRADLAIGSDEDIGSLVNAGAVNVLYASALPGIEGVLSANPDPWPASQFWHQGLVLTDNGATTDSPDVAEQDDYFGYALTCGDYNGDGLFDLVVGTPGEDVGGIASAGVVQVLYGSSVHGLSTFDQLFTQPEGGVGNFPNAGDSFGYALG